ncbi:lysozyme inhibitor LprI family protein [Azospirillum sp. SYSU D00513]|uniref:lysozyme inhibitor LprI family protein n=1 Tax=Azospirillum sp. SYSU D00513 TaxID=2812561 RepID=UPI001A96E038|nr:lysozyme inhibitor LprI family protein [Azospirillum sp. SYSU D00513]
MNITSKIRVTAAFLLPVLMLPAMAIASPEESYSVRFSQCMDRSGGVTSEMLDCISAEHERQDALLNVAYKAAMKAAEETDPARSKELRDVQRTWLKYRELKCGFEAGAGGTIAIVNAASCNLAMTAERAKELEHIAEVY